MTALTHSLSPRATLLSPQYLCINDPSHFILYYCFKCLCVGLGKWREWGKRGGGESNRERVREKNRECEREQEREMRERERERLVEENLLK